MKTLTRSQIYEICKKHKYALFRENITGELHGYNCKIGLKIYPKYADHKRKRTNYVSFIPCNISEYITYKLRLCLNENFKLKTVI